MSVDKTAAAILAFKGSLLTYVEDGFEVTSAGLSVVDLQAMAKLWLCRGVLREVLEYHADRNDNIKLIEPHETINHNDTQETELECLGCQAKGVKRWSNHWQNEFEHELDCKWVALIEALEDNDE